MNRTHLLRSGLTLSCLICLVLVPARAVEAKPCWQTPATVETMTVAKKKVAKSIEVPATVKGIQTVDLYSKVGGYLEEINVDIGDEFKAGQALAKLDIPEMESQLLQKESLVAQSEAEVLQSKSAVKEAEARLRGYEAAIDEARSLRAAKQAMVDYELREFDRLKRLAENSSIRRELVDTARLKVQSAQSDFETVAARVATAKANLIGAEASIDKAKADVVAASSRVMVAKANLEYTNQMMNYGTIKAPWDGIVIARHVHAGAFVQSADGNSAAQPMLRIARVDTVRVECSLSTANIENLDKGDRAVLGRIDGLKGKEFVGKVKRFSAGMNEETRMMKVEVELPNEKGLLKPGFFGYLTIDLVGKMERAVVPATALQGTPGDQFVFLDISGKAMKRPVSVAFRDGRSVAISKGLRAGDKVITKSSVKLTEGQAIRAKK
jgi:HlyD family secretion protein